MFRTLSRLSYPVCLLLMSGPAISYSPSVGFDVLGIHQTRWTICNTSSPSLCRHIIMILRSKHCQYDYLFHSTFIPIFCHYDDIRFCTHSGAFLWVSKRHPRFTSIATAFRIYQSSFSTSGKALVMACPNHHYQCLSRSNHTNDASDYTIMDGIISRLLDLWLIACVSTFPSSGSWIEQIHYSKTNLNLILQLPQW
jgi:hypothetical protein